MELTVIPLVGTAIHHHPRLVRIVGEQPAHVDIESPRDAHRYRYRRSAVFSLDFREIALGQTGTTTQFLQGEATLPAQRANQRCHPVSVTRGVRGVRDATLLTI
ncbi:Uncharacterised protein [Mycobacteroides abscessus subsp. abscessus]|nr:Uncharacterised protein [Mycobacteroides abscessus subsp. abscessus]